MSEAPNANGLDIAIIGMAGRFPDAGDVETFWRNIEAGVESIRKLSADERDPGEGIASDDYVDAGAYLDQVEWFDAGLFGYSPREAQVMDPQHRIFLETAWEALEHAGCAPEHYAGQIGVYAGASISSYLVEQLLSADVAARQGLLGDLVQANAPDLLATRLSYKLDLRGPAITLGTACSTSLVLLHYACQGLLAGDCDVALVGGARVSVPHKTGYQYAEGGILSRDGRCRSFDADASGTVAGNGVGAVVLTRLSDAIEDRDTVYAVVKATAINNDGARKVGYTAPSVDGQAEVIRRALMTAEVSAGSIGYLEGHGTATYLGDPIEVKALTQAYRGFTDRRGFCALGSVKANIGHCDAAAGIAGVIKVAQMLRHGVLPPSVAFDRPNPELNLAQSPFYIARERSAWPDATPRRAGVSAFGIGGTNAHAILEQPPVASPSGDSREWQVLGFSGKSRAALQANIDRFAQWLRDGAEVASAATFADAAFTLKTGRRGLEYRHAIIARDARDAELQLTKQAVAEQARDRARPVIFMFSGQGAQYPGMGRGLYESEPVFRAAVDRCARILQPLLGQDIRQAMFPPRDPARSPLYRTAITQPALFTLEFALVELFDSWGIRPRACIGHSIGEYVAAHVAGVFTLEDALSLVVARAAAMEAMPSGAMLSVEMTAEDLRARLAPNLSIAAINAPSLCVVSGPEDAMAGLQAELEAASVGTRRLHASHAFHSAMMEPCLQAFAKAFAAVELRVPKLPFISCVTGEWITAEQATRPAYWLSQLRAGVEFSKGLRCVLRDESALLVELGPGQTLRGLAELHEGVDRARPALATLPDFKHAGEDARTVAATLARLWSLGVAVDWSGYYRDERRRKIALPTYAFQRQRYWLDGVGARAAAPASSGARLPLPRWFHRIAWRQAPAEPTPEVAADERWLVFVDGLGVGARLKAELRRRGAQVWTVRQGGGFRELGGQAFEVDPTDAMDYKRLFARLREHDALPSRIVHGWHLAPRVKRGVTPDSTNYESLLHIARACPDSGQPIELHVLSTHLHEVAGGDEVEPERALLVGPCRVIPQEYRHLRCKSIDLSIAPKSLFRRARPFDVAALIAELRWREGETFVALRGRQRFIQFFEALAVGDTAIDVADTSPRAGATYFISGGFGGIGASIARHLARQGRANLILTGRGDVPPQDEWDEWLATHDAGNAKSRRIALLRELKAEGARVEVIAADVADLPAMRKALARAERRVGAVRGVIHAAGVADGALIQRRDAEDSWRVMRPKVAGTLVLDALFADRALDFFVLCSSLAAPLGPMGQVAYCAANAFQDAFAQSRAAASGTRYRSIGWDSWRDVGMAVDSILGGRTGSTAMAQIAHGITNDEGLEVLRRALAGAQPHVFVSTRGWPLPAQGDEAQASDDQAVANAPTAHPRPDLSCEFLAPRNEIESRIAEIWQNRMGVGPLGVRDDFFELNGHSLMAVQITHEIKRQFQVTLPAGLIYDRSTVEQLSEYVAKHRAVAPADQAQAMSA